MELFSIGQTTLYHSTEESKHLLMEKRRVFVAGRDVNFNVHLVSINQGLRIMLCDQDMISRESH